MAHLLLAPGKGILAADESTTSADKRLASYGIATGAEMRQEYRDLFLDAPGIEEYISGVILHEETLGQKANNGTQFPELLTQKGIVPGIKVDEGTEPFAESPDELITKGLLGLDTRLAEYRSAHKTGFTKWRAVVRIEGDRLPTGSALVENARRLASYAAEVQRAGMVPLLEPEVLYDGNHSRVRSRAVIEATLRVLFDAVEMQGVDMSGVILKSSMALSGKESKRRDTPEEVAEDTLGAFIATVPSSVAGIVFLSGGQDNDQATDNLRAIARLAQEKNAPWPLTFSYARALQDEALTTWAGKPENVEAAREAFRKRLATVAAASKGE